MCSSDLGTVGLLERGPLGGGAVITAAAEYIGITEEELREQLAEGKTLAQVAEENGGTRDGLISAISSALVARINEEVPVLVDRTFPQRPGPGHGRPPQSRWHAAIEIWHATAEYLGIPNGQLRQQVSEGTTLGEIADATEGKSREGLIAYLVAGAAEYLDEAVADGRLTQDQADQIETTLEERVTRAVDRELPTFKFRGGEGVETREG